MTSKTIANGIIRAVAIIAGIVLLVYFLYLIRSVLAYLALAAVTALVGRPVVLFLRRRLKFPNTLAVITHHADDGGDPGRHCFPVCSPDNGAG